MKWLVILCFTTQAQQDANVFQNQDQALLPQPGRAFMEEKKSDNNYDMQPRKLDDQMFTPDDDDVDQQPKHEIDDPDADPDHKADEPSDIIEKEQAGPGGMAVGMGAGVALAGALAVGAFFYLNGKTEEKVADSITPVEKETSQNLVPLVAMSVVAVAAVGFAGYTVYKAKLPVLEKEIEINGLPGFLGKVFGGTVATVVIVSMAMNVLGPDTGYRAVGLFGSAMSIYFARPHYLHMKQNTWNTGAWNLFCLTYWTLQTLGFGVITVQGLPDELKKYLD